MREARAIVSLDALIIFYKIEAALLYLISTLNYRAHRIGVGRKAARTPGQQCLG